METSAAPWAHVAWEGLYFVTSKKRGGVQGGEGEERGEVREEEEREREGKG